MERDEENQQEANRQRIAFEAVCKALAVAGVADIAPIQGNWSLIQAQLPANPTIKQISDAITNGSVQGLSPNDPEQVAKWKHDKEIAERQQLSREIADAWSNDQASRDAEYERLIKSVGIPIQAMRDRVAAIRARQEARSMSKEELREIVKKGDAERRAAFATPPLPDTWKGEKLDAHFIRTCSPAIQRLLAQKFGNAALDARLRQEN